MADTPARRDTPRDLATQATARRLGSFGFKLHEVEILESYTKGLSMSQISEKHGLAGAHKAQKLINDMLKKLDKAIIKGTDRVRAREFLRLETVTAALEPKMDDPKVAAELRLHSESRRRLYGVDLQREVEVEVPEIHVHFGVPEEAGPAPVDAEFEVVEPDQIESGEASDAEAADGP